MFAGIRLVLVDRDGVINADSADFVKTPEEWVPLPGAMRAIALLSAAGLTVAVCSNQSGVARGLVTSAALAAIHKKMHAAAREVGGSLSVVRYCPHGPGSDCRCRKPRSGMIEDICRLSGVPPSEALFVGDAERDLQAARAAKVRAVLVRTGHGRETETRMAQDGTLVFDDLLDVANALCPLSTS